jgi:undecaprenyl-diphosphatase
VLFAASGYELFKHRSLLSADDLGMFAVGFVFAFVAGFLCVRWLLRYISHHDFTVFAWYRIGFGALVLITAYAKLVDWTVD